MIDTHAHIDANAFDSDRDNVIQNAFQSGVEYIIIPAINPENFNDVIDLSYKYDRIFCGIGIHPHDAEKVNDSDFDTISKLAVRDKVVAIGEIGLDYYYDFSTPETQKKVFRRQLKIAKELDKPVIVHNRDSNDDLLEILKSEQDGNLRGVLHCFSGDDDYLNNALDLGFYVSYTGNITFKKFPFTDTVKNTPLDRFLLETDSPYMTPVPFRGKRNDPSFVKLVAEKIAEIKNINFTEVIKMSTKNAFDLFKLPVIAALFILLTIPAFSQTEEDEEEEYVNPFKKTVGIGLVVATNTIVESYEPRPMSVSYEGLLALGGTIHYSPLDFLVFTTSYTYAKNTKINEKFVDLAPNIHQQLEFTSNFIINPHSRINFFGMFGLSYLMNEYGKPYGGTYNDNQLGINSGLGFYANIPITGAGNFTLVAEWKLNFMLATTNLDYDPRIKPGDPGFNDPVQVNTFFSLPRISLVWFPEFIFD